MGLTLIWLEFAGLAAVIGVGGWFLSLYGDIIAEKTGWSQESIYVRASQGHILSAGVGIVLIGFVGFNLLLAGGKTTLSIGHVGYYTPSSSSSISSPCALC